jgi:hypothetical protein
VLPRIVRGAKAAGTGTAAGIEAPPAGAESSDGTRSTLAEVVSLLSGFMKPKGNTP